MAKRRSRRTVSVTRRGRFWCVLERETGAPGAFKVSCHRKKSSAVVAQKRRRVKNAKLLRSEARWRRDYIGT